MNRCIIPSEALSRQRTERPTSRADSQTRDTRLDFWRGLCLIDMTLVHLAYQNVQFGNALENFITRYSRFAAGGFIFIAGMSVGLIFLPRARDPKRRKQTYEALAARSIYILLVQYFCALGLLAMQWICGAPQAGSPLSAIRAIILLRQGGDLLPFYVLMIAFCPLMLELFKRNLLWVVLLASALLYAFGHWHPWALAIAQHDNFPPILWQFIFIIGLTFGSVWPRYDRLPRSRKIFAALTAWSIFALLFVSEYSSYFGFPALNLGLTFTKVPLSVGETLRYLSLVIGIVTTTDLLWVQIKDSIASRFAQTLGRRSLPVYVAHLWVVQFAGVVAGSLWWIGRSQILLAIGTLGILWMFAHWLDFRAASTKRPKPASSWAGFPEIRMSRPMTD